MNKRLELIASILPHGRGFADVGTDHGYLPVYMAQHGYSGKIIASDINEGPLSTAVASARQAGVEDRICFRLCDGLDGCGSEELDTVVIAGMGGDTICGILDRADWVMSRDILLILQPMTKAEVLRYWLTNNDFAICGEWLIEENGEIYQILSARFGARTPLSDAELFTGKYELAVGNALFPVQLAALIKRFERAAAGMSKAPRMRGRQKLTAEILNGLYEMRDAVL
mgnify:FL=1